MGIIQKIHGIKTISIFSTFRFSSHTFQLLLKDDMGLRKTPILLYIYIYVIKKPSMTKDDIWIYNDIYIYMYGYA